MPGDTIKIIIIIIMHDCTKNASNFYYFYNIFFIKNVNISFNESLKI